MTYKLIYASKTILLSIFKLTIYMSLGLSFPLTYPGDRVDLHGVPVVQFRQELRSRRFLEGTEEFDGETGHIVDNKNKTEFDFYILGTTDRSKG